MAFTMACPNFKKCLKMVSGPLGVKKQWVQGLGGGVGNRQPLQIIIVITLYYIQFLCGTSTFNKSCVSYAKCIHLKTMQELFAYTIVYSNYQCCTSSKRFLLPPSPLFHLSALVHTY
jgi:hypothetical protein